jgi:hypothetical protein
MEEFSTEAPDPFEARRKRARKIHAWTAAVAVIALFVLAWDDFYLWILGRPTWLVLLGLGVAIVYIYNEDLYDAHKAPALSVWIVAGAVVLALISVRALADASDYHHANCWKIEGTKDRWECVPGSEPRQNPPGYSQFTDTETPGRFCEHISTTSSGGTIWDCEDI